jgi:hypothetical protein
MGEAKGQSEPRRVMRFIQRVFNKAKEIYGRNGGDMNDEVMIATRPTFATLSRLELLRDLTDRRVISDLPNNLKTRRNQTSI